MKIPTHPRAFFLAGVAVLAFLSPRSLPAQQATEPLQARSSVISDESDSGEQPHFCLGAKTKSESRQLMAEAASQLPQHARNWLNEDAAYIISTEERCAFITLTSDQARKQFIDQFWLRRNPEPDSQGNIFKEEHYRRIVLANERFSAGAPGWETDRGHIYIQWGQPDSIESHQAKELINPPSPGAVKSYPYATEIWKYRYLEGIGENVVLDFVDPDASGDYRLTMSAELAFEPPSDAAGSLVYGAPVLSGSSNCLSVVTGPSSVSAVQHNPCQGSESLGSDGVFIVAGGAKAFDPESPFRELEAAIVSRLVRSDVEFRFEIQYAQATQASTVATLSLHFSNVYASQQVADSSAQPVIEYAARISDSSGWIWDTFKGAVPGCRTDESNSAEALCSSETALPPGVYKLAIAVHDVSADQYSTKFTTIEVPTYDELPPPQ